MRTTARTTAARVQGYGDVGYRDHATPTPEPGSLVLLAAENSPP